MDHICQAMLSKCYNYVAVLQYQLTSNMYINFI